MRALRWREAKVCDCGRPRYAIVVLDNLDSVGVGRLCHVVILFGVDAEVPIIDGSALGWASEIVRAGLQDARDAAGLEASVHPPASLPQEVCKPFLVLVSRRNAWCCSMGEDRVTGFPSQPANID